MQCSVKVILALAVVLFANCNNAHAEYQDVVKTAPVADAADTPPLLVWNDQQEEEWEAEKNIINSWPDSMPAQERCEKVWDSVWPLAKAGNLGARSSLFMAFDRYWRTFNIDNRRIDLISMERIRDILFFHSLGAPNTMVEVEQLRRNMRIATAQGRTMVYGPYILQKNPALLECVLNQASQVCTQIAENGGIPTFRQFAAEIDLLLAAKHLNVSCASIR